jgi:hypothetical protein
MTFSLPPGGTVSGGGQAPQPSSLTHDRTHTTTPDGHEPSGATTTGEAPPMIRRNPIRAAVCGCEAVAA